MSDTPDVRGEIEAGLVALFYEALTKTCHPLCHVCKAAAETCARAWCDRFFGTTDPSVVDGERVPTVRTYDRDGTPHDDVLRTKTGRIITEEDIARWAEEAERGYDAR